MTESAIQLFQNDEYVTIPEAAKLLPPGRGGARCHAATVWRWSRNGIKRADGERAYLPVLRRGGVALVGKNALCEFIQALSYNHDAAPTPVRTAAQRSRAAEMAERKLIAAGL